MQLITLRKMQGDFFFMNIWSDPIVHLAVLL